MLINELLRERLISILSKTKKPPVDYSTSGFDLLRRGGGIRTRDPLVPNQVH